MTSSRKFDHRRFYATKSPPLELAIQPFHRFFQAEATGGLILLACAVFAMIAANSPWAEAWEAFWNTSFAIGPDPFLLDKPLRLWVNEGLMTLFFFLVGLEIKREFLVGELASPSQASLPVVAAAGGMIVPALLYAVFNAGLPTSGGWGTPMATDIAFALCALSLAGPIPLSVKVFLTALAIVDDIGAVLVIALFYSPDVSMPALGTGAALLLCAAVGNFLGARSPLYYALVGAAAWVAFLKSGIHASVEGVLLAMCVPARPRCAPQDFTLAARNLLDRFESAKRDVLTSHSRMAALQALKEACRDAATPLQRMEDALAPWSAYVVMPVFALANAGVSLEGGMADRMLHPVTLGVAVGLVLGKQAGVFGSVWLFVRLGLGSLPTGMTWRHVYGASLLAGIGFTMSLFIAHLAFASPGYLAMAKTGVILASLAAGAAGWLYLRLFAASASDAPEESEGER